MYPWLWLWSPRFHYPWSGAVSQDIRPTTTWFSEHISDDAGNAAIEERAFAIASYGRQLGLITEALLALGEQAEGLAPEATEALRRLEEIRAQIESVKESEYQHAASRILSAVGAMQARGGSEFEELARQLRPLLDSTP